MAQNEDGRPAIDPHPQPYLLRSESRYAFRKLVCFWWRQWVLLLSSLIGDGKGDGVVGGVGLPRSLTTGQTSGCLPFHAYAVGSA